MPVSFLSLSRFKNLDLFLQMNHVSMRLNDSKSEGRRVTGKGLESRLLTSALVSFTLPNPASDSLCFQDDGKGAILAVPMVNVPAYLPRTGPLSAVLPGHTCVTLRQALEPRCQEGMTGLCSLFHHSTVQNRCSSIC